MSGNGAKKVAEVAVKASKSIDWDGMAKLLVSDEARKEFSNLRRAFDDVNHQLQTKFSLEPEPIDWDYYRKRIGSRLVDQYKEAYDSKPDFCDFFWNYGSHVLRTLLSELMPISSSSLSTMHNCYSFDVSQYVNGIEIPKFVDTVTPEYKPKFDALLVEFKEAEKKSLERSAQLEKEIAEVQETKKKIATMTADEYFEKHPELRKQFDDEIRNDNWGY
ncbi:hypothetical protein ZIOFF_026576 [Zingiber officinale]|uniref:ATP synthase subunit d, mitochondrial n=1 Tax=Zingiber officinale TaxID=94328 RepID=A0A8J5GYE4_ZINOF|nr:hypothetical protein ZIOFF_026576 [Zingiber officinale]